MLALTGARGRKDDGRRGGGAAAGELRLAEDGGQAAADSLAVGKGAT